MNAHRACALSVATTHWTRRHGRESPRATRSPVNQTGRADQMTQSHDEESNRLVSCVCLSCDRAVATVDQSRRGTRVGEKTSQQPSFRKHSAQRVTFQSTLQNKVTTNLFLYLF